MVAQGAASAAKKDAGLGTLGSEGLADNVITNCALLLEFTALHFGKSFFEHFLRHEVVTEELLVLTDAASHLPGGAGSARERTLQVKNAHMTPGSVCVIFLEIIIFTRYSSYGL